MSLQAPASWFEANQRYLTLHLARIRSLFADSASEGFSGEAELRELAENMSAPAALETLCAVFGLSPFERDVLLLCAGLELDAQFAGLLAPRTTPSFGMALAVLPEAHWNALTAAAPLRRWRLLEVGSGSGLTQAPLRIDEPILHYLTGAGYLDERLSGYVEPLPAASDAVESHQAIAEQIATAWSGGPNAGQLPLIQLYGMDAVSRQQVALTASALLGLRVSAMRIQNIPTSPVEADSLLRLWERQSALGNQVLLLSCEDAEATQSKHWLETVRFPLILSTRERIAVNPGNFGASGRQMLTFEVRKPTPAEQGTLWRKALGPAAAQLNGHIDLLTGQFNLDENSIGLIATTALRNTADFDLADALWQACRAQSQPRLGELAQQITPMAGWDDLVLPEAQLQTLHEVAIHVRQRMKVYQTWGFAGKSARGLGISALFAGISGTGKTMAAEVLANELQLDLYRIDLSQVVSKYIGETEKNLRRVFDAADECGAILLFDEADALFGKRSEVKDSHDRYANVEVSYLLQRMESYRGLAILTTNLKDAIDSAFMRRIRFIVQFPFPDAAQRGEIWRRIFPQQTPTEGLDVEQLARLTVAGGNIRNIAIYAAFLAADAGEPVRMTHLLRAVQSEYSKLEKPLSQAEIGGWR